LIGQLIKKGIGINARGMAVYIAGRLALKWRSLLVNAVGKMMAPMMPLMIDPSDPLRNETAGSMPFLLNAASDKTKQNFLDRSQKLYLQARNDDLPNVIGRVLSKSISKFDADFYPFVAPLVYLGQFDPVDGSHFTGMWEQGYFKLRHIGQECVDLILVAIESTTWSFRGQGLKALEQLTSSGRIDSILGKMKAPLERKYFNGKESIIKGLNYIKLIKLFN